MASDFHTHNQAPVIRALISSTHPLPGQLTSFEYHPWKIPSFFDSRELPDPAELASFAALGEIGIDKLRGPALDIQQRYFSTLLQITSECHKPVIIHCVRAWQEIFSLLKPYRLQVMFHGFRGSPEMLNELWKRHYTVSFHPSICSNMPLLSMLKKAGGSYGFESDDCAETSVPELLGKVCHASGIIDIEKITDQNFADFLEI
jgi:TatD DNase family protein